MRIDKEIIIIEHPDDWKHEMLAGAVADPIAEPTDEHGVVRVRCRTNLTLPDARIVVECRLFWLPESMRYGIEFEEDEYA
jgi:hypothetical protein